MNEEFEINLVCPERTLGLQIDGKNPPFRVKPVKVPSAETEIEEGNILVGLDEWKFIPATRISEVLEKIRKVMASDQPVIKLVLQRTNDRSAGWTWECQRCTMVNTRIQALCTTCGLKQLESMKRWKCGTKTDWNCPSCTYGNPSDREKCVMCETARSGLGVKSEYVSGNKNMDEQLEIALEHSVSQQNVYHPMENTYETEGKPNAPELLASQNSQNQSASQMQYRQQLMAPIQLHMPMKQPFQSQQPHMQSYCQYPQPQPQPAQQHPYIQQFPPSFQQLPIQAPGYTEDKIVLLQDPQLLAKEPKPKPESAKSVEHQRSWKCGLCTTSNDEEAVKCDTCHAPRMYDEGKAEDKLHLQTTRTSVKHQARKWKCPSCHYENKFSDGRCLMCSRSPSHMETYEVRSDPKEALETIDRENIAMEWLQKQLVTENLCTAADFDAAFRRADHQITEAVFRITSGFQHLDLFKGKLERFLGGHVRSLKRMGEQLEGRLQKLGNELERFNIRYQETIEFFNITQQEIDEKSYLKEYEAKLDKLIRQEEDLKHRLNEIKTQKDEVTLMMRSEQINKKLQVENCDTVMKQLKEHLSFLRTEKNELDVQVEMIGQQVKNYNDMRRSLENVKLNDLKSAVKTFQPIRDQQNYSQTKTDTSSLLDHKEVNNMASKQRKELPEHPENFHKFFTGEKTDILMSKDQGDTFDENSDGILFRK